MKHGAFKWPLIAGFFLCLQAKAAWLQICPADSTAVPGRLQALITRPDKPGLLARVADTPAGPTCEQLELPLSASDVVGLHPIAARLAADRAPGLSISAKKNGEHFIFGEVSSDMPAPALKQTLAPQPVLFRTNLLSSLSATPFGAENRAKAALTNGLLSMQCTAGKQAAGLVLSLNASPTRARAKLQISGSGNGRFEIIGVNAEQAATESGSHLGYFEAPVGEHSQAYLLASDWFRWTLACPASAAELHLSMLQLIPQAVATPNRAAWIWQPGQWQQHPDAVFRHAKKYALGTLFITIPVTAGNVQNPRQLAAFIRRAASAGIGVWSVDGDPNMIQSKERTTTEERVRAYARFNRSMPLNTRLKGVQFDIEPYLLAGYELATEAWDQQYIDLVKALHEADPDIARGILKLDTVVPFWWAGKPDLLSAIAPWVSGLVVMDYRTEASEIYRFAVPFLEWGARHEKTVRIALEAGPIAPETRYRYEQAPVGELWQLQLGEHHLLMMLGSAQINPNGRAFRQASSYEVSGHATTFYGDTAQLWHQLPALEADFSAWPGFAGMALHEIR